MIFSRLAMSGVCALAALALVGLAPAWGLTASLRDSLGATADDRFTAPKEGRFRAESGQVFVLDRTLGSSVMVKFDSSPEIWVLRPHPGPRGDVIYKNDVGEQVLRATRVGGLTLFTRTSPGGVAAAFSGEGPALRPPPVNSASGLLQSLTLASARAGRAARQVIYFEAQEVPISSAGVFADAAQIVAEAFMHVAARGGRAAGGLNRWKRVELVVGSRPAVAGADSTLRVTVNPTEGLAGRPSSQRIAEALSRGPRPEPTRPSVVRSPLR